MFEALRESYLDFRVVSMLIGVAILTVMLIVFLVKTIIRMVQERRDYDKYFAGETRRLINERKMVDHDKR